MLNRQAKKLLWFLNTHSSPQSSQSICSTLNCSEDSLEKTFCYLRSCGYLSYSWSLNFQDYNYELTYTGEHFQAFERLEIRRFIVRSVVVPVLVSLLVSAATNLLWPK